MIETISSLFGDNASPAVGVIAMFALAILAIGLLLWIAKRILGGTFVAGGRARHLRLAVIDATPVDSRRRLVLVRRDDVEHLILIGGPTDVVVEQNIRLSSPSAAKPAIGGIQPEAAPQRPDTNSEDRDIGRLTMPAEPVQSKTPAPAIQAERQAIPARPQPAAPVRPAPLPPKPLEPARINPQPSATVPPRPVPAYMPPSTGPAAGLAGSSLQPRPADPPRPSAPPAVMPAAPEPVTEPLFARQGTIDPKIAAAAVTPLAAVVLPAAPKPVEPLEPENSIPDPNDSLLLDLSDEIARVAGTESDAQEISLEEEMESLLADLDVKAERTT